MTYPYRTSTNDLLTRYQVKRFAQDVVGPKVREMDENEMMDPSVVKGLFEQGVRNSALIYGTCLTYA
jgi:hypothetical protein